MKTILSVYLLFGIFTLSAQDIGSIMKGDVLKGTGGLSFNQIYYSAYGKAPSRIPYTYMLNGNLNLKILGFIDAPFNFMYSNLGNRSTQPTFNQTSIHPSYKWISTHFGSISCNYSPYTVNGHMFNGYAVDLTPGKVSFSAFYGRLLKAVRPEDITGNMNSMPVYKRMGGGCKIGYKGSGSGILELVFFEAKDDKESLPLLNAPVSVAPKQNWNSGLKFQRTFLKKLNLSGDLAYSMMTEDLRVQERNTAFPGWFGFTNANASTRIDKAFKSCVAYQLSKWNVNAAYERVDPFYRTMGAYYFNNDLENVTGGLSGSLFKQKVNFTANAGLQRDNLLKAKLSTMNRWVCNSNLSIKPGPRLNINLGYSNFLSYSNLRASEDYRNQMTTYNQWDTLNFRQIARNITGNLMLMVRADSIVVSGLTGSFTFQNAADKQGGVIRNGSVFLNANLGYSITRLRTGESIVLAFNAGRSSVNEMDVLNICPVVILSKPFLNKKLKPGISLCYTNSYFDRKYSGGIINVRGTLSYTVQKVHNFSLSFLILNRKDAPVTSLYTHNRRSTESTVSLTYSVNMEFFDVKKWWDRKNPDSGNKYQSTIQTNPSLP